MLPTPSTSHVDFDRIYEPAEDSYLLLDTLSSPSETSFLSTRFPATSPVPLILEIGTGSGVVLSFVHANAGVIFGHGEVLTMGVDVNVFACQATAKTVAVAENEGAKEAKPEEELKHGFYLGNVLSDLSSSLRPGQVDVLIFNPPYVPTATLPSLDSLSPSPLLLSNPASTKPEPTPYEKDSHLLELSYAGGADGMETTDRLLDALPEVLSQRGCVYVLLCAQNRPAVVMGRIRAWEGGWRAEIVGKSGKVAGWEKLVIVRIWREDV